MVAASIRPSIGAGCRVPSAKPFGNHRRRDLAGNGARRSIIFQRGRSQAAIWTLLARFSCIMDHAAFCGTVIQREAPCREASPCNSIKNKPAAQLFAEAGAARWTWFQHRSVAVTPICDGLQWNRWHNCALSPFLVALTDSMCSTSSFVGDYRSFPG